MIHFIANCGHFVVHHSPSSLAKIVCSRSGPTETISTGMPIIWLSRSRYRRVLAGKSRNAADIADFRLPAGQGLVNRHDAAQIVHVTGKIGRFPAVQFIGGANFDFRQLAEHVQQHDAQYVHPAQARRVTNGHGIEPAATTRTPGNGPVFVAPVADVLAGGVVLLGGERAAADPGGVGLDNADYLGDVSARHPGPGDTPTPELLLLVTNGKVP